MNPHNEYRSQCERMRTCLEDMERMLKALQSEVQSLMDDLAVTVAHLDAEEKSSPMSETAVPADFETASVVPLAGENLLAATDPSALSSVESGREILPESTEPVEIPDSEPENTAFGEPEALSVVTEEMMASEAVPTTSASTQTLAQQFEQAAKPNLQQTLGGVHSSDFLKSLSLNDRFRLTRELFTGDSGAFAEAVTIISHSRDSREAIGYLRQTIHWDERNETVMEFRERIEQFFLQK